MKTSIQWTDATWNPATGCSKVSSGCKNCYAETIAKRFWKDRKFTDVLTHTERLEQPLHWRKPRRVFVNSMSDLFHEDVPFEFIDKVFVVMALCPQHTFQILTKRPERMKEFMDSRSRVFLRNTARGMYLSCIQDPVDIDDRIRFRPYPFSNVHLGVSVEDQVTADQRIPILLQTPAVVRFVSAEPLICPVDLSQCNHPSKELGAHSIDWIIIGGESGPNARPFNIQWARDVRDQCKAANVACFVKQLGSNPRGVTTRLTLKSRSGSDMDEWPEDLRVREYPL